MEQKILDFITKDRICVMSVVLADGASHSATVHYSHQPEPLNLYIQTTDGTTKIKPFLDGKVGKASIVIGFTEGEWITLQMRGDMSIISDTEELEIVHKIHYAKFSTAEKYNDSKTVFLKFVPKWLRFTDGDGIVEKELVSK